jgi:predicted nucleic-acid-binding Zn-ribbon protein
MDDQPTRRLDAPDAPPQPSDRCPKCSGSRIWVRAIDRGHYNNVFDLCLQPFKARRSLFHPPPRTSLSAFMCITCGYTELYARDPQKMLEQ